ncbi:glycosyltransferase family 4 protein [Pseudoalteromonas xiamenensis]|uniref:Glycosyltransferase family 4 protein n=1 Tax=Pseudoalteromonas xiamenensis TaxID=882626 RepID=A0A975HM42_9GAMM|nr:glycosyltransferase family 4 protein [Pseudoalteromonas xiamenensis]QTH72582.1 glycosyltransferase family 4 protein [Pseudoalteromonas xiamenensis]
MKKHIILTSNAYYPNLGGIENSLFYLAKSFMQSGTEVDIVVSDVNGMNDEVLPRFEVIDGVNVHRYGAKTALPLLGSISSFYVLYCLLKKLKQPQTLGVVSRFHHTTWIAKLARIGKVLYLVPGVVAHQDAPHNLQLVDGLKRFKLVAKQKLHALSQRIAFKYADEVFVFSQNMLKQVNQVIGKSGAHIQIVKPGVDTDRFCPPTLSEKKASRESLNITMDKVLVVAIGRFVRAKGFHHLIQAMNHLSDVHLIIVGDGPQKGELEQVIADHKLESVVTLLPFTPEPLMYYQAADVFVMSSTYEPLGQTILEALSVGLPIVAFEPSLVPDTATFELLGSEHASYASSLNGNALALAISNAHAQYQDEGFVLKNRLLAQEMFDWDKLSRDLLLKTAK